MGPPGPPSPLGDLMGSRFSLKALLTFMVACSSAPERFQGIILCWTVVDTAMLITDGEVAFSFGSWA